MGFNSPGQHETCAKYVNQYVKYDRFFVIKAHMYAGYGIKYAAYDKICRRVCSILKQILC